MPDQQAHVFISYSRRDSQFARRVVNELGRHGRDIWVDWEDINVAEDWLQAVYNGIETSDTFIFIITRNSVMSEVCNLEIQHARLHNKRIIPIVHEPIEGTLLEEVQTFWDDTEWSEMAYKNWQTIGHLNWLFFVDSAIFSSQISNLVRVIDTDLKHIKAHTRLLVRAREWETNAQSNSFLASGDELITAETWLKATEENEKDPPPTALHKRYIEASREAEDAMNARIKRLRQTSLLAGIATGLLVLAAIAAGVISLTAVNNSNAASTRVVIADTEVAQAQADIDLAQTSEADANAQVILASTQLSDANAQVQSANATLEPIQQTLTPVAISLTDSALAQATANAQIIQSGTDVARAEIDAMTATVQLATADAQVAVADSQIGTADAQLVVAQGQIATADIQVTQAQNQLATAAAQGTQAQDEIVAANSQLSVAEEQIATANVEVTQAQLQISTADAQIVVAQAQLATADVQVTQAQEQIATADVQVTQAQEQIATADVQVTQAQADLAEAQVALTQVAPALTQASDTIQLASTEVADVQEQISVASTESAIIQADAAESRRQADSQALIFSAEQAIETGQLDLALPLLLRSYDINPNLAQTQRLLNTIAYTTARFIVDSPFLVFNHDGTAIAYAEENTVIVQDITTRSELARLEEHTATVTIADFSDDGRYFLSGDTTGTLLVWNTSTWQVIRTLDGLTGAVVDAEFDANTTRIVAISDDELVIVWQINNSFTPREIPVNPGTLLNRVAFFGDGSRLIVWGTDGQQEVVYNINTGTGATARNFDLIYESLNPAFADDTVRFALTDDSDQLIRYDVANGAALRFERGISFGVDTVGARALNSIGNAIAVVITDGETNQSRLDIFDAGTREARRNLIFENSADMRITALAFSPEGDALLGADGRYLVIWDTVSGRQLNRLAGHADDIINISYSPNSDYVITLSRDGNRRVWDVAPNDPSVIARLTTNSLYEGVVANPALSPDGTEVYFNVGFGINRLNIATGESSPEIAVFDLDYVFFSDTTPLAISIVSTINSLEMWDVTDFDSRIWDTPLGAPAGETMESIGTFSPDSTRIAVVMTNAVRVYDTSRRVTPSSPTLLDRRGLDISAVAFSEDNSTLYGAVNTVDGVETYGIAVWDIETGTRTLVNIPHVNRINALDLSADGTQLLTASTDNTLVLFDLANAQISRRLSGHQGAVNAVQFSREDSVALSASEDGTLILWDLALGEPVRQYISSGNVVGLDVSIDGRLAATTNNSDFVTIWEIQSTDEIATWIRANRTIPVLSAEQFGQFQAACD